MITIEKLDRLNDIEILIFNEVLKHKRYYDIGVKLGFRKLVIGNMMVDIYRKLDIWPHKPQNLRKIWILSLKVEKENRRTYYQYVHHALELGSMNSKFPLINI